MTTQPPPDSNNLELTPAQLQWQDDGAPFSSQYGDVYFSRSGGLAETHHVFLNANALQQRWRELDARENPGVFTIGELGFGTGLNFLACWQLWQQTGCQRLRLHFISCEKHPLTQEALQQALQQWPELKRWADSLIQAYPPAVPGYHRLLMSTGAVDENPVTLDLYYGDAQVMLSQQSSPHARVDAWFLDGFSPDLNPDLWSETLLDTLARLSRHNTTLSSYSVTGRVVRYLKSLGFVVEKRQGFGSKRHMLFARLENSSGDTDAPEPARTAIVIGAGLAGASVARALALRGLHVRVLEQASTPASGASGNRQAVVQLRLNKQADDTWAFHLHSYLYALRFYNSLQRTAPEFNWHACGVLTLNSAYTYTRDLSASWQHYPASTLQALDADQVRSLTGLDLQESGLWQAAGGWINPQQCVQICLAHQGIELHCNTQVSALQTDGQRWWVETRNVMPDGSTTPGQTLSADCVIVANSYEARNFEQTLVYPVSPLRGQVSHLNQTPASQQVKQVICSQRYLAPADAQGIHCAGASYIKHSRDTVLNPAEHEENLTKLGALSALLDFRQDTPLAGRASIRGASLDYLPIAGAVADPAPAASEPGSEYGGARHLSAVSAMSPISGQTPPASVIPALPGLYISSGHGSHGTVSCPLIAEHLAALICHEVSPLPQPQAAVINPSRFIARQRKRQQTQQHSRG